MRSDLGETEAEASLKNKKSTDALFARLNKHHAPLEPIPNEVIARATDFAFPKMILNRVEAIQRATLTEFPTITMHELKSQRRTALVVRARQIAMYLAKKLTGQSLPEIGRRFGDRDHTTVLHAVRKIEERLQQDASLAAMIGRIKEVIPETSA